MLMKRSEIHVGGPNCGVCNFPERAEQERKMVEAEIKRVIATLRLPKCP